MNVKSFGVLFVLLLIWVTYWECTKPLTKRRDKPYVQLSKRMRRMLATHQVSTLCARHLPNKQGKMSIVDANNCLKCKGDKK